MNIDINFIKRLNFVFCKNTASFLLIDYMENRSELNESQLLVRIPFLIEFMEWQIAYGNPILTQYSLEEFLRDLYKKKSPATAYRTRSYVKDFCNHLCASGYCGAIEFILSKEDKTDDCNEDIQPEEMKECNENNDVNKDECSESTKRRRGRPRKNKQTNDDCQSSDDQVEIQTEPSKTESEESTEQPKRRRGRPRKNKEECAQQSVNEKTECASEEEVRNDSAEQPKRRRGRPRKTDKQQENTSEMHSENTESNAKRCGRPRKNNNTETQPNTDADEQTSKRKRGRPRKGENRLKRVINYYEALGVSPDSDISEIKKAYRRLAFLTHPDLHKDDPLATERFSALNGIFSILENRVERMVYDVAMGFIKYDKDMRFESPEPITWWPKRHYITWM